MSRLAGFRYIDVIRKLKTFGFQFDRNGPGSHELWRHSEKRIIVTIPHHPGDMKTGTLRAILREAQIEIDEFLRR